MQAGQLAAKWWSAQEGRFALWLPVCALAGDAAFFTLRHEPPGWLGAAVLLAGVALAAIRSLPIRAMGLVLAMLGFGFGAAQFAAREAPQFIALPRHAVPVIGRVVQADALPDGQRVLLDRLLIDGKPAGPRRLSLRAAAAPVLWPGMRVRLRAMVAPPPPPAYPGGPDRQRDAFFTGLAGYGYALGATTLLDDGQARGLARLRARIADRVRSVLPGADGAIAATVLTGLSAAIPQPDRDAFRDAGLAHLLAIAGLHMGLVMGLALAATRGVLRRFEYPALFWPLREISALAALAAGLAYLLLTGNHVPLLRSFVMAALAALALLAGRRPFSLRGWGLALLVVIAVAPAQITGPSFQLSFAAVLALIAGYEALRQPLAAMRGQGLPRRLAHHLALLALTSLLAGGASLPFVAYHFGRIQLYFVLSNLLAVPMMGLLVMPAGLLALLLMPLHLDRLALVPMGWGIDLILRLAHAVASWPAATLAVPGITMAALLCIGFGLAWLCLWRGPPRLAGLVFLLCGCLLAARTRLPDVLVSPDTRVVGLRAGGALSVWTTRGGDAAVLDGWSRYLGRPPLPGAPCPDGGCALLADGSVLLNRKRPDCATARILLTQSGEPDYCPGTLPIGRGETWDDGAWAAWLRPYPHAVSDRDRRGDRPWVFLAPEQNRAAIDLPMAPTDPLSPEPLPAHPLPPDMR